MIFVSKQLLLFSPKVEQLRVNETSGEPRYPPGVTLNYPVDNATASAMMQYIDYVYDPSALPSGFDRFFEV